MVPPDGWKPQPWSGKPPKGASDLSEVPLGGDVDSAVDVCQTLCGGAGRNVRVTPRLQPLQLFNKAFEPADDVSVVEYRKLAEAAWPSDDLDACKDLNERGRKAEREFWNLMARQRKSSESRC